MAKRICKGNIGEKFTVQVGDQEPYYSVLLDYIPGPNGQAKFADPYFPDGRWGAWRIDRFDGKWWRNGKRVRILK